MDGDEPVNALELSTFALDDADCSDRLRLRDRSVDCFREPRVDVDTLRFLLRGGGAVMGGRVSTAADVDEP